MNEPPGQSEERPARILIVDDEPLNVDYLEQELGALGFVTESAADGVEALERVKRSPPDLVLLDVMMPRMDGISTLRLLKDDRETRLIPVVLMTALNAVEDRVRGIEAGADDFLSKPVDERELLARIRTALDLRRAIDDTVDELRSASAQLERYGRQRREVAVLAVDWQLRESGLPEGALGFVGRREREAATRRIRARGGLPTENEDGPVIAIFDGPDRKSRAIAATEAAEAVLAEGTREDTADNLTVSAAVSVGPAEVGSIRVLREDELRWAYTAEGRPVERASEMVRRATGRQLLLDPDAAAAVSERFALEPEGAGGYRVLERTEGDRTADGPEAHLRRVRTLLITDIVDSTKTAERIGDRAWTELVGEHDRATREVLVLFGGEELATTGDGFIAAFDSPARAIQCAIALVERVAALGLEIRAGVHTAEVEYVEGEPGGIALNIATRVTARANGGEVLVSDTTRELAAGSGLAFADRGEHILKGVSGQKRLYAAVDEGSRVPRRR
jgi:CheY-like chemotaxis protein/class 3 adenylate cyclase